MLLVMARRRKRRRRQFTTTKIRKQSNNNNLRKKPFRFFKIIFPDILHQQRLRIPDDFSKKFAPELSKVVTLTIPTGLCWKIALSQIDNKLYFAQGWVDFMEANDIRYGYFLEFGYCGNNHFEVYIFNLTSCQIDYSTEYDCCIIGHKDFQNVKHFEVKEDVEVYESEESKENHGADRIQKNRSESPSFTVTLRRFFRNLCHIPKSFLEEHLHSYRRSLGFVKIQTGNGEVWRVGCYHFARGIRLTAGWRRFVEDNHWSEGESYTFALVAKNRTSVVFEVFKEGAFA